MPSDCKQIVLPEDVWARLSNAERPGETHGDAVDRLLDLAEVVEALQGNDAATAFRHLLEDAGASDRVLWDQLIALLDPYMDLDLEGGE